MGTPKSRVRPAGRRRRPIQGQLSLPVGRQTAANHGSVLKGCEVVSVGKRRDGGTRYWCLKHKADATAKYGRRAKACRFAHVPMITEDETLHLRLSDYPGGVAL